MPCTFIIFESGITGHNTNLFFIYALLRACADIMTHEIADVVVPEEPRGYIPLVGEGQ